MSEIKERFISSSSLATSHETRGNIVFTANFKPISQAEGNTYAVNFLRINLGVFRLVLRLFIFKCKIPALQCCYIKHRDVILHLPLSSQHGIHTIN